MLQTLEELLIPSDTTSTGGHDDTNDTSFQATEDLTLDPDSTPGTREVGTQCSFDRQSYIITTNASTQTDPILDKVEDNVCPPTENPVSSDVWLVKHDHTYARDKIRDITPSPQKLEPCVTPVREKDEEDTDFNGFDEDDNDQDFTLAQDQLSSTDTDTDPENVEDSHVEAPKYIVFRSSLSEFFKYCMNCGQIVTDVIYSLTGSLVSVRTTCMKGHDTTWHSQPIINNRSPVGNLLISSAIPFTGNTFNAIKNFAFCLNLKIISERVFYSIQDRYLFPVINEKWKATRGTILQELRQKPLVKLNGDGRCDSPGHNAKYGTYTLMESDSGKVVEFNVVQVSEVTSSNAMEKEGFERCLNTLRDNRVSIDTITTDRHISINSAMDKVHTDIKHQYDVWHFAKSIVKKLNKQAKLKKNQDLAPWIQSISNHLWWSAATCDGNAKLLEEKWLSVLSHISNKHSWRRRRGQLYHRCSHQVLTRAQKKATAWLKPGSSAFVALEEIVTNPRLLAGLPKLTDFCHTGGLEVYHSMMLKYLPKREHFSYKGMVSRTQLAAIDNNENAARGQAVIQKGGKIGEARYRKCFPKTHKRWVVKPILQPKTYAFLPELQSKVLKLCQDGNAAALVTDVELPKNIASEPDPGKQELIRRHHSRFNR